MARITVGFVFEIGNALTTVNLNDFIDSSLTDLRHTAGRYGLDISAGSRVITSTETANEISMKIACASLVPIRSSVPLKKRA